MPNFRVLPQLTLAKVAEEWDSLAPIRLEQILSGRDVTFNKVILPAFDQLILHERTRSALDAGCGVGVFTNHIAQHFDKVIGVDPSHVSVDLASQHATTKTTFAWSSIEQFSTATKSRFDVITANMVLMDVPDLGTFMASVRKLLRPGGSFIFSVTHPCFWPSYYGYADEEWFNYNKTLIIESPFRISNESCRLVSTHVHRPIEEYARHFDETGLTLETLIEPFPDAHIQTLYPEPWKAPRYLLGRCRRPRLFAYKNGTAD